MIIAILNGLTKKVFGLHDFIEFNLLVNIVSLKRIGVASNN